MKTYPPMKREIKPPTVAMVVFLQGKEIEELKKQQQREWDELVSLGKFIEDLKEV